MSGLWGTTTIPFLYSPIQTKTNWKPVFTPCSKSNNSCYVMPPCLPYPPYDSDNVWWSWRDTSSRCLDTVRSRSLPSVRPRREKRWLVRLLNESNQEGRRGCRSGHVWAFNQCIPSQKLQYDLIMLINQIWKFNEVQITFIVAGKSFLSTNVVRGIAYDA